MHDLQNLYAPFVLWGVSLLALVLGVLWLLISDWWRKRKQGKRAHILIALVLTLQSAVQPTPPLALDASAQGRTLTIVVFADAPTQMRITLPPGWTGAPREQAISEGVQVKSYALEPGAAVGQGEILVQAWAGGAGGAYASDRAWVWGATAEAAPAQRPGIRARLAVVRR